MQVARITTCAYMSNPALTSVPAPVMATSAGPAHRVLAARVSRKMIATYAATPKNAIGTPRSTELGCDATVTQPLLVPQGTGSFRMCPALRTAAAKSPPKATNNVATGTQAPRCLTDPISSASGMDAMMERFIINRGGRDDERNVGLNPHQKQTALEPRPPHLHHRSLEVVCVNGGTRVVIEGAADRLQLATRTQALTTRRAATRQTMSFGTRTILSRIWFAATPAPTHK